MIAIYLIFFLNKIFISKMLFIASNTSFKIKKTKMSKGNGNAWVDWRKYLFFSKMSGLFKKSLIYFDKM